jgi:para-nitrobenzyl esterase
MMRSVAIALLFMLFVACTRQPEVNVDGEQLRGERLDGTGIAVFRGIPFAEPPLGDLRWRAPQPLQTKVPDRNATEFAPACMQSMGILEWYRDMAELFGSTRDEFSDLTVSEDCLYLNIWTASLDEDARRPVMVYIHGGSNDQGWAYEPDYHGHVLAERGVVLVSIAYRLGVFGFLSHPDIGDSEAQANFGLWDQVAALEWIQKNISKFGGDPGRVTVFGESAGSQDVLALMTSERAAGLFHGSILQSNAGFGIGRRGSPSLDDERQRGMDTAALFGFDGNDAWQQLKSVPAGELLAKYEETFSSYYHSPAIDGQILERSVWETINDGGLTDIPFIIGSNGDEWYSRVPEDAGEAELLQAIESSSHLNSPDTLAALQSETDYRRAIDRISAGNGMLCPSQYSAAQYDDAWVYHFTRIRDGEGGAAVRAYHGAELPYVFGTHPSWMATSDIDRHLTDQILSYWTQFAATGNPNSPGLPEWPSFSLPGHQVMVFGDEVTATGAPEPDLCQIFSASITETRQ